MDIPLREFNNKNWDGDDFECTLTNDDSYYGTSLYFAHNNIPDPNKQKIIQCKLCCVIL